MTDQKIVDDQEKYAYDHLNNFIQRYFQNKPPKLERTKVDEHFDILYTSCTRVGICELKVRAKNMYSTVIFEKLKYDECRDQVLNEGRRFIYINFWKNNVTIQDLTHYFLNPESFKWKRELHNKTDQTTEKVWKDVTYLPTNKFTKIYSLK